MSKKQNDWLQLGLLIGVTLVSQLGLMWLGEYVQGMIQ